MDLSLFGCREINQSINLIVNDGRGYRVDSLMHLDENSNQSMQQGRLDQERLRYKYPGFLEDEGIGIGILRLTLWRRLWHRGTRGV